MPAYDYICMDCGAKKEVQASITEKEKGLKITCDKCGSSNMKQFFGDTKVGSFFPLH